jgi:uncharacterized protein
MTETRRYAESGETVEVVRDIYDAFARGDVEAIFGLVHPEAEIYQSDQLPWGGKYRGHQGFGEFLTKLTSTIESRVETGLFIDDEDGHVVQVGRTRGKVRATGREFDVPETHVWTVEGNKAIRYEAYVDTAKFREALEL